MEILESLKRYPIDWGKDLRAWDAADELILSQALDLKEKRVLIINDSMGALSISLKQYSPVIYTDSFVSFKAITNNSNDEVTILNDLSQLEGVFDFVIVKLPKNLSYFEDILMNLTNHMGASSKLICGSMIKHMAKGHFDLIGKYIGETTTSLAKKKARLIYSDFKLDKVESKFPLKISLSSWPHTIINHSNLFSREKLDIGTRFFLENIPSGEFSDILDLGCANGIVGLEAKRKNPNAKITFNDESFMAIKSAKENYEENFDDVPTFNWSNCHIEKKSDEFDLILCNPPFHQGTTVGDFIAWQMFKDSYDCLKKGGRIRVIGNRHLGYHVKLKKLFKNSTIVTQNKKFVIIDATK